MRASLRTLLLAAGAAISTWAADRTVSGHIYDIQTGQVVSGASITFIEETGARVVRQATSDSSGAYSVQLPEGTYDVLATKTDGEKQRELRTWLILTGD